MTQSDILNAKEYFLPEPFSYLISMTMPIYQCVLVSNSYSEIDFWNKTTHTHDEYWQIHLSRKKTEFFSTIITGQSRCGNCLNQESFRMYKKVNMYIFIIFMDILLQSLVISCHIEISNSLARLGHGHLTLKIKCHRKQYKT